MSRIFLKLTVSFLICICAQPFFSFSQNSFNDKFNDANLLMDEKLYAIALPVWLEILQNDTDNCNWNYKVGLCYFNSANERAKSLSYFEKAIHKSTKNYNPFSPDEKNSPMDAYYYLAKAYHLNNQIDKAVEYFNKFKEVAGKKHFLIPDVDRSLEMCQNAKELMAKPLTVKITNIGNTINSSAPEYGPLISLDERALYFTSRRLWLDSSNAEYKDRADGIYFEDIYVSYKGMNGKWESPEMLNFNRIDDHEATVSLSADGQTIYLYIDDGGDGNLYQSFLFGETWTAPVPLGEEINSKSLETHMSISLDGKTIYFVSNRKGGLGEKDIYVCTKLPNGKWSAPQNIGPTINTPYDEDSPFIHPDGKTLYFSSHGHKSIGGYDIFMTTHNDDGTWTTPYNIGYPINTTDDDIFFILSPDGKRAYYSSVRSDGFGDKDIYLVEQPDAIEKSLTLIKGYIHVPDGQELPEDIAIIITDNETGQFVTEVKPLKRNGSFVFVIPSGKNYNISYTANGVEFYNENIYVAIGSPYKEVEKEIMLNPLKLGTPDAVRINIKNATDVQKPKWKIRFRELGLEIPDGTVIQYLNDEGMVIYEEVLTKTGFFAYHELEKGKSYIFTLKAKDSPLCGKGEIVLVGKEDSSYKFLPDENCLFKEVKVQKAQFVFSSLGKELPPDLMIQYLDDAGNILFEEKVDAKGNFRFHELPKDKNYIVRLKTSDTTLCNLGEIIMPVTGGLSLVLVPDENCVYRVKEKKSTLSLLGKSVPNGLVVQYLDDNDKVIFEDKVNSKGEFGYRELSADHPYTIKLKSSDKSLCDHGEIKVPGPGGMIYTMEGDENCVFRLKGNKSQFVLDALNKTIPKGLSVQYMDGDGKIIHEDKINSKGEFAYRELSKDHPYAIKLSAKDKALCEHGEMIVPGPGGAIYTMVADETCVFRLKDKKSKFVLSSLDKVFVNGLTIQVLDEDGKLIHEEKVDEKGEFSFHKLPKDKNYALKLNTDDPGKFKDSEIIVPGVGKNFYKFKADAAGVFHMTGMLDAKMVAQIEKEKQKDKTQPGSVSFQKIIHFDYDKSNISAQFNNELNDVVNAMKENPSLKIEIFGHTDSKGTDEYNQALSQRRAENAARYLASKGISRNRVTIKGFGKTQPIAPNIHPDGSDDPEGRKQNRRIEIKVKE